jgi:hypothetical protein
MSRRRQFVVLVAFAALVAVFAAGFGYGLGGTTAAVGSATVGALLSLLGGLYALMNRGSPDARHGSE